MRTETKNTLAGMLLLTVLLGIAAAALFGLHHACGAGWALPAAITLLTVFYHLAMRLCVGEAVTFLFRGRAFPQEGLGFRLYPFEPGLYRRLRVRDWKGKVLTAKPEQFDLNRVGPEELLHNVMQAELVHRMIMPLSFVPLLFIIPFGAPAVFIVTSVLACLTDCVFVIIQRCNRPRVLRWIALADARKARRA